jgi:transcriptional regulator with XRE-family HTH domain
VQLPLPCAENRRMRKTDEDPEASAMLAEWGERLRKLRMAYGSDFRQEDLAKIVGRSRTGVDSWEQGVAFPRPPELLKLCLFFKVDADFLLFGRTSGLTLGREASLIENGIINGFEKD